MNKIEWIEKKHSGKQTVGPAGIRVSVNKNGTKDDGSARYAIVFSFDNGIEKEITAKEHIQFGVSSDDRIYFAGADSKKGYKLCARKGASVKTCQFQVEDPEKWFAWEGSFKPLLDPECKLYYIVKKGSAS